ncbi:MAG: cytochrome P450, partial [Gammaproteobacteria bacterium]
MHTETLTPPEIPVHGGLPLLGNTLEYLRDADAFLMAMQARYGEIVRMRAFGKRFVLLMGPDANQQVFQNRDQAFSTSAWEYFFGPFFRRGLLMLDFDEHRLHRAIMAPAFRKEALERYLPAMNTRIAASLAAWDTGSRVAMFPRLKSMTLDVGTEAFLGVTPSADSRAVNQALLDMVQAVLGIVRLPIPGTRWSAGIRGRRLMERYFRDLLPRKRADTDASDLLAQLCRARSEDGTPFTDEDVINHIILILMAAHDTATITLSNLVYHLAKHPQWQERLRSQALSHDSDTPGYEALQAMEELDWAMREALRLCPPVVITPRGVVKDTDYKGWPLRAGELVMLGTWNSHRDAAWWREPELFDPERFAPTR